MWKQPVLGVGDALNDALERDSGDVRTDEHELVAGDAGNGVDGADVSAELDGDVAQDAVADLVTVAVVDGLEVVDVAESDAHLAAGSRTFGQREFEAIEEQRPISKAGQRVRDGEGAQLDVTSASLKLTFGLPGEREQRSALGVSDLARLAPKRAEHTDTLASAGNRHAGVEPDSRAAGDARMFSPLRVSAESRTTSTPSGLSTVAAQNDRWFGTLPPRPSGMPTMALVKCRLSSTKFIAATGLSHTDAASAARSS